MRDALHDVLVIGGGPSGLHAAFRLAANGFDTHIFEEHGVVGTPVHCTGILGSEAFDEYELPRETILHNLTSVRLFSPISHSFTFQTDRPEAVVVDRTAFDESLLRRAISKGVTVHHDSKVTNVQIEADHVRITTATGHCHSGRTCILACGATYTLHRRLGLGLPRAFMQSAQVELRVCRRSSLEMHFGRAVAPGGFAWVVPFHRNEHTYARIGLMADTCAGDYFRKFIDRMSDRWGILESKPPRRKILPLGSISKTFGARLLAVGDAAGLVKPMTGGGIYYSLITAELAFRVLADSIRRGDLSEGSLQRYQLLWRSRLGPELQAQSDLRKLARDLADSDIESLFKLAEVNGIVPLIRRTARFNHYRRFINELLSHPGAKEILFRTILR